MHLERAAVDGQPPAPVELREQRPGVERVAAGAVQQRPQGGPRRRAVTVRDQGAQLGVVEPADLRGGHTGARGQREELFPHRQRTGGEQHRERQLGRGEPGEHGERIGIGLVHVVGDQDDRAAVAQPLHPVHDAFGLVGGRGVREVEADQPGDEAERPTPGGVVGGRAEQPRRVRPEGEQRGERVEGGRLPDPRPSGQQQHGRVVQQRHQPSDVSRSDDERSRHRSSLDGRPRPPHRLNERSEPSEMADGAPPPPAHRERMSTGTHLSGPFTPVVGELPGDLNGAYLCIGDHRAHRVTIEAGHARYDNRFVRTSTPRDLPAVNIVRHGGRLLALAECARPHVLDDRLDTVGPCTFDGVLPDGICAHPKIDPATGEMLVFRYRRTPPFLAWTTIGRDGTARPMTPVDGIERPSMIHDMAITRRYVVLVVAPLFFDGQAAMAGGSLLYWQPEHGTRIALVPRDGGPVRWCHDDAFWVWHTANAHDVDDPVAGNPVVLDYAEWPRPGGRARAHLARAVIDPAAGVVRRTVVDDLDVDFCRIDDRLIGRAHPVSAFAVATGAPLPHPGGRDALAWHDTRTDAVATWRPDGLAVGEPVFAPDPRSDAPDRGWWLTFTTRHSTGACALVVIPAADPARGPMAEIRMPVCVPLGQHGNWITY